MDAFFAFVVDLAISLPRFRSLANLCSAASGMSNEKTGGVKQVGHSWPTQAEPPRSRAAAFHDWLLPTGQEGIESHVGETFAVTVKEGGVESHRVTPGDAAQIDAIGVRNLQRVAFHRGT